MRKAKEEASTWQIWHSPRQVQSIPVNAAAQGGQTTQKHQQYMIAWSYC